ncbi:glyoxylate/hydroxypyruvate reductase A [Mesorhizobium sp. BR1-1-16]|uniref:2-hydroxyacid dehydrogenase n=1 Tax=Mesorhizobium sp. BR1-1-16 TaxID=2876653 RepID=UPI001CCB18C1|nr:glyoxylate/hydroxypyruvate reductase A [Mesorhizobium sp. BR1-1-16]MBZ9938525.1 glyoxylate/hydroxypyruvate reductase A [Mesorhizobium sp. BR1-1-16]
MTADATLPGVLVASGHWDPEPWALPFRADPGRPVMVWPKVTDPAAIHYVLAWAPPPEAFLGLPNLKAIFSLGAGVDHILGKAALPNVPVVRIVDPDLTMRMTEWVVLQVLLHHRRQLAYLRQQAAHRWEEIGQPVARDVRVGLMGLGELGQASARVLRSLGFDVAGWSRTPRTVPGVTCFSGTDGLEPFLARTDILVVLLPATPETRGILNRALFAKLPRDGALGGAVLINAGRGALQVEADIVEALETGALIGASLDVFEKEPLPSESPLWSRPDVVITPHVAATSDAAVLADGIRRAILDFEAGKPLSNLIDPKRGY